MKDKTNRVNTGRRQAIKTLAGTTAAAMTITSLPSLATTPQQASPISIEATLVSIPGTDQETLILRNLTDEPLAISQFKEAHLKFDGEIVDCSAVCKNETLVIPANDDIMVHFKSDSTSRPNTMAKHLDVQAVVSRLPEGTRVVPFRAYMHQSAATVVPA
ncbi:MAG: hypothetical protein KTR35_13850 [Gammaproteobacteria bacterium]|nr:hypothetical protein [Gammaproteobacteria bacterium]